MIGPTRGSACVDLSFVDHLFLDFYNSERVEIGTSDHNCILARPLQRKRTVKRHILYDRRLSHVLVFEQSFLYNDLPTIQSADGIEQKFETFLPVS